MNLETTISVYAASSHVLAGTRLEGFNNWQQEQIRAVLSQIPDSLLANFTAIVADHSLGAKHGQYDEKTGIVHLNPRDFHNRVRFGRGPGRKLPHIDLTLAHELGHSIYIELPEATKAAWRRLSGWQEGGGEGQAQPYTEKRSGWPKKTSTETFKEGAEFTRRYGSKNSGEDFADSFGFWVLGQKNRLPPEKQTFMGKLLK